MMTDTTTTTLHKFSLKNKFSRLPDSHHHTAEFGSRSEYNNIQMALIKRQASFSGKEVKKTKNRSAKWVITLTSPIEALDA